MTAFNKRFQPWDIWGLPAAGLLGVVGGLVGGLMTVLLPMPLNVLFGIGGVIAVMVALAAFVLGDEFPWLFLKALHAVERRRPSQFGGRE